MIQITNNTPVVLNPIYADNLSKPFDPVDIMKNVFVKPLLTPRVASAPVTITEDNNPIGEDEITDMVLACFGERIDPAAEARLKGLFKQTIVYYDAKTFMPARETFALQSGEKEHLDQPSASCIWVPSDVKTTSMEFLGGLCSEDKFFATLDYYARPDTLGFWFINETAFDDFKAWVQQQIVALGQALPPETTRLAGEFNKVKLSGLTESIILREADDEGYDEYCFARLIVYFLMSYTQVAKHTEFGTLPFSIPELVCPRTVTFVNVEKHARATTNQIASEWTIIRDAISTSKPNVVSNGALLKSIHNQLKNGFRPTNLKKQSAVTSSSGIKRLTAPAKNVQRIQAMAQQIINQMSGSGIAGGGFGQGSDGVDARVPLRFSKTSLTTLDISRRIAKLIMHKAHVNRSMNSYKKVKASFAKPNRRNPDDFNKQGKVVSTEYKPDIHLYVDTSGSISEENYQDAIRCCIRLAKKLNISLYFNSFSHKISPTTRIPTKDKTTEQIYRLFQKIPKVTGGTDYEQIWNVIEQSKKRKAEISLIITDFEYYPPNHYIKHPKNLYYLPCGRTDWDSIVRSATQFCRSMMTIEPDIRKRLLF